MLRELIPGGAPTAISAETAFGLLNDLKPDDPANEMRLEIAIDHIEDVMRLDRKIDDYTRRIVTEVKALEHHPDPASTESGRLNAALILGEVGDVSRFPSRDHFASYTGTAPIAASSGDHHRHRLNRAGNRTLNHAMHIAAIAQIRLDTPGRSYYLRKSRRGQVEERSDPLRQTTDLRRRVATAPDRPIRRPNPRRHLAASSQPRHVSSSPTDHPTRHERTAGRCSSNPSSV